MNVAEIVKNNILEKLKNAEETNTTFYWVKPYEKGLNSAYNYISLKAYNGINRLLLEPTEYLTYNQMKELELKTGQNLHIREKARLPMAIYTNSAPKKDDNGNFIVNEESGEIEQYRFFKYYRLIKREDIINEVGENLPSRFGFAHHDHENEFEDIAIMNCEKLEKDLREYCFSKGVEIENIMDGTECYFCPQTMTIRIPFPENFNSHYEYLHSFSHEVCHLSEYLKTGKADMEIQAYSFNELIAEIGAEMILQSYFIPDTRQNKENSIAYLQSWSKFLKEDKGSKLISACSHAQQCCDDIIETRIRQQEIQEPELVFANDISR